MKMKEFCKKHKVLIAVVGIILLLVLIVLGYIYLKLKKLNYDDGTVTEEVVEIVVEESLVTDEEAEDLGEAEVILSDAEMQSDEDVFNLLLLGTDEHTSKFSTNARADSIMILSLDKKNKTMKLVSLQRGMGFPVLEGKYEGEYDWITHLFRYGGADLMLKSIRQVLNIEIEHYVRVNAYTFQELINCVGGVDVELTAAEVEAFAKRRKTNYLIHEATVGKNHLDGFNAFVYSQLRSIDSDWNRIQRQRNVLESLVVSAKDMSIKDLNDMLDTMLPLVQTNLDILDIVGLLSYAPAVLGMEMEQMTIPVKGTYGSMKGLGGRNLYAVDFEENSKILHEFLYGVEAETEVEGETEVGSEEGN